MLLRDVLINAVFSGQIYFYSGQILLVLSRMAWGYSPLSFRTVDSVEYKKAMLVFYEQNNIAAFKQIFIEQYEFAVKNYF